jgi:hypothetical protein
MSAVIASLLIIGSLSGAAPRFYPDDPIWVDDDAVVDASKAAAQEDSNGYDFVVNTFGNKGERRDVRALNVNTIDEVPDSSWFTNRIGRREIALDDLVRGPDRGPSQISIDGWVISRDKGAGIQPGFRMTDPAGQTYQIEVDPHDHPEMATGAEMIGTAFYYAFGYHTVDVYLTEFDADALVISEKATIRDVFTGKRRPFTRRDLDYVLRQAARLPNGRYRALASRFASGRPLGNFRYYGTRPDDPNDIVPHEHRRELRGARVFGAWLNHDDSRGVNSLDMLETRDGRGFIKHYMFDFGSILGSGTVFAQRHRAGNEYIFEHAPGWKTLATLGFYVRPWMLIDYPDVPPAIGRFEGDAFDPVKWKPEYPNTAFDNMRPDDAFWATRIVSRFSDSMIRAIVEKARYSDPRATDYMTGTLIKRRDKVVRTWLNGVNPVVDPSLNASGALAFTNLAMTANVADAPSSYMLQWFRVDNVANTRENVGEPMTVTSTTAQAPATLTAADGGAYIGVAITAAHAAHPAWAKPATFYFRRADGGWTWVGAERE